MTRPGETVSRALLVVGSLLAALLLLEGVLQVAARFVDADARLGSRSAPSGARRVLFVGDSNTYGLYVGRENAFPRLFERAWSAAGATSLEVVNLGWPGTNSSLVVRNLEGYLDDLRPDVIVAMVGVNDYWTAPVSGDDGPGTTTTSPGGRAPAGSVLEASRVYRLLYMLWRRLVTREVTVVDAHAGGATVEFEGQAFEMRFEPREDGAGAREIERDLRENLQILVDASAGAGAELVLMTYPSGTIHYRRANRILRRAAARGKVRFVDHEADFVAVCAEEPCPEWFYADSHPTAAGHRRMADTLVEFFREKPGR